MRQRLAYWLARFGVPDARGLVLRGGDDAFAFGVEGDVANYILMLQRLADWLARLASQMRAVLSHDAVTTRSPFGSKTAA